MFVSFEQRYKILRTRGVRVVAAALFALLAGTWFWVSAVLPERENFTLYFSSNIHGLSVGQVEEIRIVSVPANDIRRRYYAAVTISLNVESLGGKQNEKTGFARERLPELIRLGLRGQLRMPSLLANGLCVSLYFAPGQPVNYINPPDARYPEIPTNFKSTSDLVDQINAFIETKNLYDLAEKIRSLRAKVLAFSAATESFNARETNRKILDFLEKTNRALTGTEFRVAIAEINADLFSLCEKLEQRENISTEEYESLRKNTESFVRALREIQIRAQTIRENLSDESVLPGLRRLQEIRKQCAPLIDLGKTVFF